MMKEPIEITQKYFVVTQDDELLRLDRFLMKKGISDSRDTVQLLIERGGILLNDRIVTFSSKRVREDNRIFVRPILLPPLLSHREELRIIYHDNDIVVVNKPTGILSLPEDKKSYNVLNIMKRILKGVDRIIFPVHRLDRDTSGVMIFARNNNAVEFLKKQFEQRRVKKKYIALLTGNLKKDSGTIKGIMRSSGEFGESTYRVLERLKYSTFVEVYPKTGRTNQIRIQFSEIGHPLVGENKYMRTSRGPCIIFPRVALHSLSISFTHPGNLEEVTFTAEIPGDIKGLLDYLKNS